MALQSACTLGGPAFRSGARQATIWLALATLLTSGCAARPSASVPAVQPAGQGLRAHAPITAVAVDPGGGRRMYAGSADLPGLWAGPVPGAAREAGSGWQPVPGAVSEAPVYALLAGSAPRTLWAGTGGGLFTRAGTGDAWQRVAGVPAVPIYALAEESPGTLLAGGSGPVIYRMRPGQGWQPLAPLVPEAGAAITQTTAGASPPVSVLALAAGLHGLLLAGTDGRGLFRSQDGGQSWVLVPEIGRTFVAALCLAGGDQPGPGLARTRRGLFRTADGGATWQAAAESVAGRIDALACGTGGRASVIGTSLGDVYRSADGTAWERFGRGLGRGGLFFTLLPGAGTGASETWLAGVETGLYQSEDGGMTWRAAEPAPGWVSAAALAATRSGLLYLGNTDGVYISTDDGQSWTPRRAGLPPAGVVAVAVAPANPQRVYAGLDGAGVYRSDDGGQSWQPTGWTSQSVPGLLLDPRDPDHLYMRVAYQRVYESQDGGAHWSARWDGLGLQTQIVSLAQDPADPARLYVGGTEGFFASQDGAAQWQGMGPELAGQTIFTLVPEGGQLYAGATQGLYRSADGGRHWQPWGQALAGTSVSALAWLPGQAGTGYAGTRDHGLWLTRDGGQNWQAVPLDGGATSIQALAYAAGGRWLLAAGQRGVYRVATPVEGG